MRGRHAICLPALLGALLGVLCGDALARRYPYGKIDLQRYGRLREAERYQIDVAGRLFKQEKWRSALAEYEKFIKLHIKSVGAPYAQLRIAQCYEFRKLVNRAVEEYTAVVQYFPKAPEAPIAVFCIGRCLEGSGDFEPAIGQYGKVVADYPKATIAGDALWAGADLAQRKGQLETAIEFRKRIVADYPKAKRRREAAEWLTRHYLVTGKNIPAARDFIRAVRSEVDGEMYMAHQIHSHAYSLYRNKDTRKDAPAVMDGAIALFEGVYRQWPESRQAREASRYVIRSHWYSGRLKEGVAAGEEHAKRFEDDDGGRQWTGRILEQMDKWNEARLWYLRYKNRAGGAMEAAASYSRQRKYKEAHAAYMAVVQQYPDHAKRALYNLGYMHQHYSRDYAKAVNAYRHSEYSPPSYLFEMAECFRRWKKYDESIGIYRQIRGFFPAHAPEAMWRQAHVHEQRRKKGDELKAVTLLKKLCDEYPRTGQASRAHHRLESKYKISYTGGGLTR